MAVGGKTPQFEPEKHKLVQMSVVAAEVKKAIIKRNFLHFQISILLSPFLNYNFLFMKFGPG
jgi:hypothetical protein